MIQPKPHQNPTESHQREQLAAYFLSAPSPENRSAAQQQVYWDKLRQLGELEQKELQEAAGGNRPLVWGTPAHLLQALLSAAQRLGARLGQPLLLFPAKDTAIGADTLLHPRVLSVTVTALLRDACRAAEGQPVWVRLQEQQNGLAVTFTAPQPFWTEQTETLAKECTRLHGGSLVHCDHRIVFTCGQVDCPPAGVHLYTCPTEQELLEDSLSPLWSGFYAPLYASGSSSGMEVTKPPLSTIPGAATSSAEESDSSDSSG